MLACFDIGGTHLRVASSALEGEIALRGERETPQRGLADLLGALQAMMPSGASGVALAVTGAVDPDSGLLRSANIPGLDGCDLARAVSAHLGLPVIAVNDADCFALAEAAAGAGRGHRTVLGIILGTGIGGGLVCGGELMQGAGGIAGEWGHGPILHEGLRIEGVELPLMHCGCGLRGCVNTLGARGLEVLHRALAGQAQGCEGLVEAWVALREPGARTVRMWIEVISGALAMVVNVTGATVIPAGGGLARNEDLVAALDQAVRRKILRQAPGPLVVPARFLDEAGLVGASILGHRKLPVVANPA
jgi:N-acetylglucosamine kinase